MRMKLLAVELATEPKVAAAEASKQVDSAEQAEKGRSPQYRQTGPRPSAPSRVAQLFSQVEEPVMRTGDVMLVPSAKKHFSKGCEKIGCHNTLDVPVPVFQIHRMKAVEGQGWGY